MPLHMGFSITVFNGWALVESEKKAFYIDHSMHIVFTFEECDTLLH